MLFTPTALILASHMQEQHFAGVRLDGPTTVGKPRRRFFSATRAWVTRPVSTGRRTLATA
jgi:hypothetical protein